jgi:hypothetical protein
MPSLNTGRGGSDEKRWWGIGGARTENVLATGLSAVGGIRRSRVAVPMGSHRRDTNQRLVSHHRGHFAGSRFLYSKEGAMSWFDIFLGGKRCKMCRKRIVGSFWGKKNLCTKCRKTHKKPWWKL